MKILISAFEPFGEDSENSSRKTCSRLGSMDGRTVSTVILPVVFEEAWKALKEKIDEEKPDAVLCLGQAEGRAAVTFEKIGINWMDARIPDNSGFQPKGIKISREGPDGLFSTVNVHQLAESVSELGIPSSVSFSAGTYVCNDLLFRMLEWIQKEKRSIKAGFVHLPLLPEQAAKRTPVPASMALNDLVLAMQKV
ncbi:MAG: pyroglutamyl-peptidase I, partial [Erysipelotrichaceae bacterium]|nr:pyroglutamyl-peptidase I [Erysipelotrichaceae bacterium]